MRFLIKWKETRKTATCSDAMRDPASPVRGGPPHMIDNLTEVNVDPLYQVGDCSNPLAVKRTCN